MQRPFEKQTMEIYEAFKQVGGMDYVRENGIAVRDILLAMQDAQSEEEFHDLAVQFKDAAVLPFYKDVVQYLGKEKADQLKASQPVLKLNKNEDLGTYDALSKRKEIKDSKYSRLVAVKQSDGSEKMENKVALLQAIEDPQELAYMANELGVTPKALKAHVQNAWQTQQAELQKKTESELKKKQAKEVEGNIKDFNESVPGTIMNIALPEMTKIGIANARGETRSPMDVVKAGLTDGATLAGSLILPEMAGAKVASMFPKAGQAVGKVMANASKSGKVQKVAEKGTPLAIDAATQGATDAAIETGRQAAVNDEMDWKNVKNVGLVSATVPAGIKGGLGILTKVPGIGAAAAKVSEHTKGMGLTPTEIEQSAIDDAIFKARNAIEATKAARGKEKAIARDYAVDYLNNVAGIANSHPNMAGVATQVTSTDVEKMLSKKSTKDIDKLTQPPTRDEYKQMIWDKVSKQGIDSDIAEESVERFKMQFPEHYKAYNNAENSKVLETIGKGIDEATNDFARYETAKARAQGKKNDEPSEQLQQAMENDPALIQQWEAGFKPRTYDPLYEEWKRKFSKRF